MQPLSALVLSTALSASLAFLPSSLQHVARPRPGASVASSVAGEEGEWFGGVPWYTPWFPDPWTDVAKSTSEMLANTPEAAEFLEVG
jgi:hypothetical protein